MTAWNNDIELNSIELNMGSLWRARYDLRIG